MEAKIVTASGLAFRPIQAGKFRRLQGAGVSMLSQLLNPQTLSLNARDLGRVGAGVVASRKIIREFNPDVVFLKGGFVCLPVGLAARLCRVPYVIHESDVTPGLTNRILARWAARIAVGFPVKNYPQFEAAQMVFVGSPVRQEILTAHRLEGLAYFKLSDDRPVVLITGGSQGAAQINNAVMDALPALTEHYQVIHQTGEGEADRLAFELSRRPALAYPERYRPFAFLVQEMPLALAAADLIIGRAGVGTIMESAALGKPTVLIPNTGMAGHQVANARVLARQGAARVLNSDTLTGAKLAREVERILGSAEDQKLLSEAIRRLAHPEADRELAELVLEVGRG